MRKFLVASLLVCTGFLVQCGSSFHPEAQTTGPQGPAGPAGPAIILTGCAAGTATLYEGFFFQSGGNTTCFSTAGVVVGETVPGFLMPSSGTLQNLTVAAGSVLPSAASFSYQASVQVSAGGASSLTCTFLLEHTVNTSGLQPTSCENVQQPITVNAGDFVSASMSSNVNLVGFALQ